MKRTDIQMMVSGPELDEPAIRLLRAADHVRQAAKRLRDDAGPYGLATVWFLSQPTAKDTTHHGPRVEGNDRPHGISPNSRFGRHPTGSAIQRLMSDSCQPVPLVLILS